MKTSLWTALAICLATASAPGASPRSLNNAGVDAFEKGNYTEAAERFRDAGAKAPEDMRLIYNRGAAQFKAGQTDKATQDFDTAARARDVEVARRARFAEGVMNFQEAQTLASQQKLDEAIAKTQKAMEVNRAVLRETPADNDARINYELAAQLRRKLEEMKQQQQKQDQQKQDKNQQDQQKNQEQQQQNEKDQQQQKDQEQQKQEQQKQDEKNQQQEQQEQQQNSEQQKQDQQEKNDQKQNPPEQQKQDRQKPEDEQRQEQQNQQAPAGAEDQKEEMKDDATASMLNLLDDNDVEAVKRMMKRRYGQAPHPEKDW